jgi:hypothetical protein
VAETVAPPPSPTAREARKGWAALIKQVYETEPLACPKCGSPMCIIPLIERRQQTFLGPIPPGFTLNSPFRSGVLAPREKANANQSFARADVTFVNGVLSTFARIVSARSEPASGARTNVSLSEAS